MLQYSRYTSESRGSSMKKRIDKKTPQLHNGKHAYHCAMEMTDILLGKVSDCEKLIEEQLNILIYLMDLIRNDLKYQSLCSMLYQKEYKAVNLRFPFPVNYYNCKGEMLCLPESGEKKIIDFSKDICIVVPWNHKRLLSAIVHLSNDGFTFHDNSHMAYYFPYVDFTYIYNGTHSASVGVAKKQGIMAAQVINIEPLFEAVFTDGENWFSTYNQSRLMTVTDFRIAVLFEMAKRIRKLQTYL